MSETVLSDSQSGHQPQYRPFPQGCCLQTGERVNDEQRFAIDNANRTKWQDVPGNRLLEFTNTKERSIVEASDGHYMAEHPPSIRKGTSLVAVDLAEIEEAEEEEVVEETGMFQGAGKFLLAGGCAGAVSRTATAPFDRLKVYLITKGGGGRLNTAIYEIWQRNGIRGFWTGNGLNIIKIFPESAIKFVSYETSKILFARHWDCVPDQSMISNTSRFISGGIGGVVSQFVIYPIETVKTRVMTSTSKDMQGNELLFRTIKEMWKAGGVPRFFKGLPVGLLGVFPYSAIDMSTYEGIKIAYAKWMGSPAEFPVTLMFGAASGGIGATSVYPLNVIRTRLQAQGTPAHPQVYSSILDAVKQCYKMEGLLGFYKGLTPTLIKVIPAVAISYAVYDQSKKLLFQEPET